MSRLSSCPELASLRANAYLTRSRHHHCPIRDRLFVPFRPRAFARFLKQFPDEQVLIVDRRFGVDSDELEDDRERLIFLNHAADELPVTLERIFDVRDILTGLVILGSACGRD